MTIRRMLISALFGCAIVAALAPSFAHVAAWWVAMVPASMPWLAIVAAGAIEGSLLAALVGMQIIGRSVAGRRWVVALLVMGWGGSTYANFVWAYRNVAGPIDLLGWADMLVGAAFLPTYAIALVHAFAHVNARMDARVAANRKPARKLMSTKTSSPVVATASPDRKPSKADAIAMIKAGDFNHIETQADLARALGVSQSAVSRWPVQRNGAGWKVTS